MAGVIRLPVPTHELPSALAGIPSTGPEQQQQQQLEREAQPPSNSRESSPTPGPLAASVAAAAGSVQAPSTPSPTVAACPPGAGCAQCWQVQEWLRIYAQAVQLVLQEAQEREQAKQCEVQALQAHVAQLQQAVQQQQLNVAAGKRCQWQPVGREASNAPAATVQPGALVVAAAGCQQGKDEQAMQALEEEVARLRRQNTALEECCRQAEAAAQRAQAEAAEARAAGATALNEAQAAAAAAAEQGAQVGQRVGVGAGEIGGHGGVVNSVKILLT